MRNKKQNRNMVGCMATRDQPHQYINNNNYVSNKLYSIILLYCLHWIQCNYINNMYNIKF